ncbi:MAG: zeta toxin family protein, partial [Chthoniobacterales bacterium]
MLVTAGGVAAGKSSVITKNVIDKADLVFDGTLRDPEWAIASIKDALDNGWKVEVAYVQRPLHLVAEGAIKRADDEGRWGPYANLPQTHLDAQKSVVEIAKHFERNPNVKVELHLNEGVHHDDPIKVLNLSEIDAGGKYSYSNIYDKDIGTGGQRSAQPGDKSRPSANRSES